MVNLFPPPPTAELPLSLGRDVILTFRNVVPGSDPVTYVDYPPDVSVALAVGTGTKTVTAEAVITGHEAVCRIESTAADKIPAGSLWRVIVSVHNGAGQPVADEVPLNGKVVRSDGA